MTGVRASICVSLHNDYILPDESPTVTVIDYLTENVLSVAALLLGLGMVIGGIAEVMIGTPIVGYTIVFVGIVLALSSFKI